MAATPLGGCDYDDSFANQYSNYEPATERYHILSVVNGGAYGVVYRAWDNNTGEIVAIKHETDGFSVPTTREIEILESLPRHPSIVELKEVIVDRFNNVLVVMEYLPADLEKLLAKRTRMPFTLSEIKLMMRQILEGVQFLHEHGVMHRDLKPANILISSKAELKICDFGLSKSNPNGCASGAHTPGVVAQWYRAPELLLGEETYSSAVDIWSVGCIMGELVLREVLFRGECEIHQLYCIGENLQRRATSPCNVLRMRMGGAAARFGGGEVLSGLGIDLLEKLLEVDQHKRITAKDALNHAWFREFYGLHLDDLDHLDLKETQQ